MRDDLAVLPVREDTLRLGDYISVVWQKKWIVAAIAILFAAAMFFRSISGPRVYESTVTFAATQSKLGDVNSMAAANTANFRPMVESLTTAAAVLKDVGLDGKIRPSEFLRDNMDVSEVRGTSLMRVTVVYTDPAMAARMANSVAQHAVEVARQVAQSEATVARDMIKVQLVEARRRLDEADQKERSYKQKAQVEAVRTDVNAQLNGRADLLDLVVSISSEQAKLERLEQDLKARPAGGAVQQELDTEVSSTRAHLASLQKQRAELIDVRKLNAAQLASLTRLYEVEADLARLRIESDLAQRIYVDMSQRYEVASLQVVGKSAELSLIDPAVPADRPVSRQVVRNTVIAGIVGFIFAVAAVLLWFSAKESRRVPPAR